MDVDDDDDFYADEGGAEEATEGKPKVEEAAQPEVKQDDEDLEEGEEEDEADSDDSDIDIITERKDGTTAAPPVQSRYNQAPPSRNAPSEAAAKSVAVKKETPPKPTSKTDLPGISFSKIDVDAKPVYEPAGKPITEVNIDEDLPDSDKPWRRPGADVSDYFNYGFDEFTWALYASKQGALRSEFDQDKLAQNQKKMMEEMSMMMMGGMPGMAGAGAGMEGMTPEMQQMMQQMMAGGMDPSQMDPAAMFAGAGAGAQGGNGQGFGGQGGFGQGQNAQMGYGYDQGGGGGGGGGGGPNRGGNYGRGRGGRGRW